MGASASGSNTPPSVSLRPVYKLTVGCRYVAALYDPSTQTLHIQNPTPLYLMAHRAKRLKLAASVKKSEMDSRAEYKARRNDLGEVFGTRKAKSQIRAEERNRVDVGAMQGVKGHLMEAIPKTAMLEEGE
jgi:DNA-directed RNA polymerase I subunit RPA49